MKKTKKRKWTSKEDEELKVRYPHENAKTIAKDLKRTHSMVLNRAYLLGIKKTKKFKQKLGEKIQETGKAFRFKKGHTPKNKGKKQIEYMTPEAIERSRKTQFKKGHIPHNALNDWEEVERKDKNGRIYTVIKVPGSRKLQYKHIWLYEKHTKQKVKKGYNVVFKDGDTQNICIENLECISDAELMQRNTYHNYPEEIAKLIQLKGAVKRQINKHKN